MFSTTGIVESLGEIFRFAVVERDSTGRGPYPGHHWLRWSMPSTRRKR